MSIAYRVVHEFVAAESVEMSVEKDQIVIGKLPIPDEKSWVLVTAFQNVKRRGYVPASFLDPLPHAESNDIIAKHESSSSHSDAPPRPSVSPLSTSKARQILNSSVANGEPNSSIQETNGGLDASQQSRTTPLAGDVDDKLSVYALSRSSAKWKAQLEKQRLQGKKDKASVSDRIASLSEACYHMEAVLVEREEVFTKFSAALQDNEQAVNEWSKRTDGVMQRILNLEAKLEAEKQSFTTG